MDEGALTLLPWTDGSRCDRSACGTWRRGKPLEKGGRANSPQPRYDRQAAMQVRAVTRGPSLGDQQKTMSDPIGRTP
jgi:hypothetical protein